MLIKSRQSEPDALPVRPICRMIFEIERVTRFVVTFDYDDNPFLVLFKKLNCVHRTPPFLQKHRPEQYAADKRMIGAWCDKSMNCSSRDKNLLFATLLMDAKKRTRLSRIRPFTSRHRCCRQRQLASLRRAEDGQLGERLPASFIPLRLRDIHRRSP
ncbi:hypothetical protein [Shinella sp. M31]|uniref:hypothetical protein n=1 Tax=Shinella sp. M31 TaxID=3368615 RepID=UPI003BA3DA16